MVRTANTQNLIDYYGGYTIGPPTSKVIIAGIQVDASVSEQHTLSGHVTSHKVEKGIDVTDNYRARPKKIRIDGVISNKQLTQGAPSSADISTDRLSETGNKTPVVEAWDRLKAIFDASEVITIETSLQTYQNMALESLSVTRGTNNGDNLRFSATAKEIRFVETGYEKPIKLPKENRGQNNKDNGKQTNKDASEKEKEKALTSIADGLGIEAEVFTETECYSIAGPDGNPIPVDGC